MKVLHLISDGGHGGISVLVRSLVVAQRQSAEVEPAILFAQSADPGRQDYADTQAKIFELNVASGYNLSPAKFRKAYRIFNAFDVLHFHFFNPLLALCAIFSHARILYTVHGTFGFFRKKTVSDYIKPPLISLFLNNYCDYITYNSEFTKSTAEKRYTVKKTPGRVVYNGVNHDGADTEPGRVPLPLESRLRSAFVVGACGRLVTEKRLDILIEAFARFHPANREAVLLIVGDGPLAGTLQKQAAALGVDRHVIFAGFQSNISDYQELMDICVMPSFGEAFGLVAIEMLALGKPALALRDGGGVAEIIAAHDANDVVDGIEGLVARLDFHHRNRPTPETVEGRQSFARQFDITVMRDEFASVYSTVMKRN